MLQYVKCTLSRVNRNISISSHEGSFTKYYDITNPRFLVVAEVIGGENVVSSTLKNDNCHLTQNVQTLEVKPARNSLTEVSETQILKTCA